MAGRVAEMVGKVVAKDKECGILGDPKFCVTLDPNPSRILSLILANISDWSAEVVIEYDPNKVNSQGILGPH